MSYSKRNNFIKKILQNCSLKISSRLFCVLQRIKHNLSWKMKFLEESTYSRYVIAKLSKLVQIRMLASFSILFAEDSLKITKGLELISRPQVSWNFLIKKNYFVILHKLAKFHYQTVPSYSIKCVLCFMLRHLMKS